MTIEQAMHIVYSVAASVESREWKIVENIEEMIYENY